MCVHARRGRCTRYHTCTSAEVAQQGREPEEPFPHPCCCSLPRCALNSPIDVCTGDDRQQQACHVRLACRSSRVTQCVLLGRFHMARLCSLLSGTTVQSPAKRLLLCMYLVNVAILRYWNSQPSRLHHLPLVHSLGVIMTITTCSQDLIDNQQSAEKKSTPERRLSTPKAKSVTTRLAAPKHPSQELLAATNPSSHIAKVKRDEKQLEPWEPHREEFPGQHR